MSDAQSSPAVDALMVGNFNGPKRRHHMVEVRIRSDVMPRVSLRVHGPENQLT